MLVADISELVHALTWRVKVSEICSFSTKIQKFNHILNISKETFKE